MSRRAKPHWPSFHGPPQDMSAAAAPQSEPSLRYLGGYSDTLKARVRRMIDKGQLGAHLLGKYPAPHEVNSDRLLRAYVQELKATHLRTSPPLSKVCYDSRLHLVHNALGTHTFVSRPQGSKLKAKRELRISSLFKRCPEPLLKMIVAHELAHLREKDHNEAFYQLCVHMDEGYHQHELDARLYLIHQELFGPLYSER